MRRDHRLTGRRPARSHFGRSPRRTGQRDLEGAAAIPAGARVWIAIGHTDMRKGMEGLALQVQKRDPHGGNLFVFRGRNGALIKIIWHVPLFQATREGTLRVGLGKGRDRLADQRAIVLPAEGDRLA